MRQRTKKTIYITSIILGLAVIGVGLVRTIYNPGFLTFERPATSSLASVQPFTAGPASAVSDTAPAPSALVKIFPSVPKTAFHIAIPSIGVDAPVEDVGIKASTGNIDTPKLLGDAAWYSGDAVPGEKGTAVILGHVDNGLGMSGVFKDLKKVAVGDDIAVTNKDGTVMHFTVTDVTNYAVVTAPVHDILHDPDDPVALKLITCDKNFYGGRFHYDHRVVVTAVPVA